MLASKHRLSKEEDFEKVKREGQVYQSVSFGASVLRKKPNKDSRFAFVVSTKISKLAAQRNRIKRALREAARHNLHIIGKGYDIVFLPKTNIARKSTEEIMREVKLFIIKQLVK